jgi:hypothetical protein
MYETEWGKHTHVYIYNCARTQKELPGSHQLITVEMLHTETNILKGAMTAAVCCRARERNPVGSVRSDRALCIFYYTHNRKYIALCGLKGSFSRFL